MEIPNEKWEEKRVNQFEQRCAIDEAFRQANEGKFPEQWVRHINMVCHCPKCQRILM